MIYSDDHYTKDCPHKDEFMKFLKGNVQLDVLKNTFPAQHQGMIAQNPASSQADHEDASSSGHVLMIGNKTITLTTRTKTYDNPEQQPSGSTSST